MAKPKSHPTSHSKSKVVHKSAQQGVVTSSQKSQTAFSAANKSLQNAGTSQPSVTPPSAAPLTKPAVVDDTSTPLVVPSTKMTPPSSLPTEVVRDANTKRSEPPRAKRRSNMRPSAWIGAGLGAILLITGAAAAGAYSHFASSDVIAPGVLIAGVPVGGLTTKAATSRVIKHFGTPSVSLLCAGQTVRLPISKLGARLSITPTVKKAFAIGRDGLLPNNLLLVYGSATGNKEFMLPIEWNKAQLVAGLREVDKKVAVAPINARLQSGFSGLEVVADHTGRELNVGAAAHLLQSKFYIGMPSLHVPSRSVAPQVSASDLDGQDVELQHYTTNFNPGLAGRTENLRIACRAIQNHVLMPGETFSFNACTGERTASKGYRMAHIFLRQPGAAESEVVEGLAGGVCQVSSTLFNAIRKANADADSNPIKIVERNTHSLPVTYVPKGLDATVAWPYKDLKFRNSTERPIYVHTEMGRSRVTISLWQRVPRT